MTWKLHNPHISVPIKKSFIGIQPCLFVSLLCMATSVLYGRVESFRQRPNGLQVRIFTVCYPLQRGFPGGSVVKNLSANAGDARDMGMISGLGRSPGIGNGNPLQYPCLENPMEPDGLQSMRSPRVRHNWVTERTDTFILSKDSLAKTWHCCFPLSVYHLCGPISRVIGRKSIKLRTTTGKTQPIDSLRMTNLDWSFYKTTSKVDPALVTQYPEGSRAFGRRCFKAEQGEWFLRKNSSLS